MYSTTPRCPALRSPLFLFLRKLKPGGHSQKMFVAYHRLISEISDMGPLCKSLGFCAARHIRAGEREIYARTPPSVVSEGGFHFFS